MARASKMKDRTEREDNRIPPYYDNSNPYEPGSIKLPRRRVGIDRSQMVIAAPKPRWSKRKK